MPELRKDPIVERWIIISTERARRPGKIIDTQRNYPPDIFEKTVQEPLLQSDQEFSRATHGLYTVINGYGVHEVIKETTENIPNMADLSVEAIENAFREYAQRIKSHENNINLKYCFINKKYLGGNKNN